MIAALAVAIISSLDKSSVALPPLMLNDDTFRTNGDAGLTAAVTTTWPLVDKLTAAGCGVGPKDRGPPLALMVRGEADAEPASDWNVALPAVLVNVVPADHCCVPLWVKLPVLTLASEDCSMPPLLNVPLLVKVPP